jgi:tetratricopeptide (TPR) repeat protein
MYDGAVQQGWRPRSQRACAAVAASLALQLGVAPAHAELPAPADAEQLADEAYQLHAAGKYPEAIAAYLKAYAASGAAVTLYNVATIYDHRLHELALAIEYYRRYASAPDADPTLVAKATERVTALKVDEARQADEAAKLAWSPAAPREKPSGIAPTSVAGMVLGGVGIASIAAAATLAVLAKEKNDDANSMCQGDACASERGVVMAHEAGNLAMASTVTFLAGLAVAGTGVALLVFAPRVAAARSTKGVVAPEIELTGTGLRLRGSF